MDQTAEEAAVACLAEAATSGIPTPALPVGSHPANVTDALAIQERLVRQSGKRIAGWKVATSPEGEVMYGTIFAEDCFPSPAVVPKNRYPMMGIEAEVAFRFVEALPAGAPLSRQAITAVLAPFPAFEIVATRFASYADTPVNDRLADRMSNGGMVIGAPAGVPPALDTVHVRLSCDGAAVVDQNGGHSRGDPLLPVIDFINAVHGARDFEVGQFITAGTYTGLRYGEAGQTWHVEFDNLGTVDLTIG